MGRDLTAKWLGEDNGCQQSDAKAVAYENDVSEGVQVTALF